MLKDIERCSKELPQSSHVKKCEPKTEIIESKDLSVAFKADLQRLSDHYGAVVQMSDENEVITKGTFTFVELDGVKLLFTADHVAEAFIKSDMSWKIFVTPSSGNGALGSRSLGPPISFNLNPHILWRSADFDCAVLYAADDISTSNMVSWFQARGNVDTMKTIRKITPQLTSEDHSMPFYILGFPDAGHLKFKSLRTEIFAPLPMPAYINHIDEHGWNGSLGCSFAPQVSLEIDVREPTAPQEGLNNIEKTIQKKLFDNQTRDNNPLGGFSGGPVVLLARDGEYLVGILKEGSMVGDGGRAFATAFDDAIQALTMSSEWKKLVLP